MKKLIYIIFTFILFLPFTINADYWMVSDPSDPVGIIIRSNSASNSSEVIRVPENARIDVLDNATIYPDNGTTCSKGWYKVSYNNKTGYGCSNYIILYKDTSGVNTNRPYTAKVDCSGYITVWDEKIKWNGKNPIDTLITGTYVDILEEYPSGNGCNEPWYKIKYHRDKIAYVCSNDISKIDELRIESDSFTTEQKNYADTLKANGFPDGYIPYLVNLKSKHPNWDFTPYITNMTWPSVISGQSGKNKLESITTTPEYLPMYVSSMIGTEGGNWYFSNDGTNAYFLDPRNFLTERFIYMFENLNFKESSHTPEKITKFVENNWLNREDIKSYLYNAGKKYNVSPFHLIARIFKEGGGNDDYEAITGNSLREPNGIKLNGYYNFFNIGAYGTGDYAGMVNGICYAAGFDSCNPNQSINTSYQRPWNSIEKAIFGGTQFIGEGYIERGQNNLYYQKFNVKVPSYHTNQYMTNIAAPSQEGETLYYRYNNMGIYNNDYTFEIPVYDEMPEFVSLPSNASTDNSLKSITINDRPIYNYDKDVREYTYYVKKEATSINIKAIASDVYATIYGLGDINITDNETITILSVKAENGDIRTYKITIKKVESVKTISEIISTLSTKTNANNMYGISPDTVSSSLINSILKADPTSYVDYKNNNNTFIKTGDKITITSSSNETITYSLIVTGDNDGNGKVDIVDLLNVQKHRLGYIKLTDVYYIASDTNFDGKVDIVDLLNIQRYRLGYSGL